VIAAVLASALPALACEVPDEGNLPLRRAVARVQLLPETEAWSKALHRTGETVQYVLRLEDTLTSAGRCYWTVDAVGEGNLWQRFYVTPDGNDLLIQGPRGSTLTLEQWRAGQR
jgi:hypothetical protein